MLRLSRSSFASPLLAGLLAGCLPALLASIAGCSSTSVPEARGALRQTPLKSQIDLAAYEKADEADDLLNDWCAEAVAVRESGEELAAENPVLGEEAAAAIERIRRASESAESEELRAVLVALADAHAERLEVLRRPGKHAPKKYLRAERKIVELGFGLRQWRNQR